MKTYTFDVYHPGERAAGIIGFSDTITITVESGDPGGDDSGEHSFQEFMLTFLREWYDGATVELRR